MKYENFVFEDYSFDSRTRILQLDYSIDQTYHFTETYKFNFDFIQYDMEALDRALQNLFFVAGISYYKTFLPNTIIVNKGKIDKKLATFLSKAYQKGLGEFFYVNKLDPSRKIIFPENIPGQKPLETKASKGKIVGIGGGKDSLVSVELLKKHNEVFNTWSLNHRSQLAPLIEQIGSEHLWVEREWDKQLLDLKNNPEAYNGHIPISAIFACVGTVVGILSGSRDNIVSNEHSANEPTLSYQGIDINHQYSKSQEFETDYQEILLHQFGESQRYYSLLRTFSELRIAELFAEQGFEQYKDVFSSCNTAFSHGNKDVFWDGTCSKCAFVFLILTPFIKKQELEKLFKGKNLLLDPSLEHVYRQLLGIEGNKPLECVGEIKESRTAMRYAQTLYPELQHKYSFEIPEHYDFRAQYPHSIPGDIKFIPNDY